MVDPQNGWFIVKNTIKMDDLGVPLFQQTFIYIYNYLFGGWPTPEKYEFVSWDDSSQYMEK